MRSVFSVIAETSPEEFERFGVSPDDLADATARRCFAVADVNQDGRCVMFVCLAARDYRA